MPYLRQQNLHRWNKQSTLRDNTWAGPYLCALFYSVAAQIFSVLCSIVITMRKQNAAQWATEGEQVPEVLELLLWKLLSTWKRILDEGGLVWWLLLALTYMKRRMHSLLFWRAKQRPLHGTYKKAGAHSVLRRNFPHLLWSLIGQVIVPRVAAVAPVYLESCFAYQIRWNSA